MKYATVTTMPAKPAQKATKATNAANGGGSRGEKIRKKEVEMKREREKNSNFPSIINNVKRHG